MRAGRLLLFPVAAFFIAAAVAWGLGEAHASTTTARRAQRTKPPGLSQAVFTGRDAARRAAIDAAVRRLNRDPRVTSRLGTMTPRRLLARVFRIAGNVLSFQIDTRVEFDGVPALGDQLRVLQRKDGAARAYVTRKATASFASE